MTKFKIGDSVKIKIDHANGTSRLCGKGFIDSIDNTTGKVVGFAGNWGVITKLDVINPSPSNNYGGLTFYPHELEPLNND